ncbi:MAG TPA: hypothetical protein VF177_02095 [Anaerolineae bacterium]
MAEEYDLAAVRNLLNDAFNAGEVRTLAFDRFQPVYNDFAAGMTKGQMIEAIVEHASKYGRIPDLLSYVKSVNAYQYGRYANQLRATPQTTSKGQGAMPSFQERRLRDLQNHIEEDAELLKDYEDELRYTDDPRRKRRIQREIERQRKSLADYQQQLEELTAAAGLTAATPSAASETAATLNAMRTDLGALQRQLGGMEKRLAAGQQTIRDDIARQQDVILVHIDERHRETIESILKQLDANQLEVVELLLDAADQKQIAQWEAQQLTLLAQQALVELQRVRESQPDAAEWQSLLALLERDISLEQKLKLTIPIIPGLLEYENELSVDLQEMLKQAWSRLTSKVKGRKA